MTITRGSIIGMLHEDSESGLFRVKRSAFIDEEIFDLEMKHIFEGNWIFRKIMIFSQLIWGASLLSSRVMAKAIWQVC